MEGLGARIVVATGTGTIVFYRASVGPVGGRDCLTAGGCGAWAAEDMKLPRSVSLEPAREEDFRRLYDRYAAAAFRG